MIGDAIFAMPSLFLADLLSRNGSKVFVYRFDWQVDQRLGAQHAADLPFLFGTLDTIASERLVGRAGAEAEAEQREELSRRFRKAVHEFAATGSPEIAGAPWQAYDTAQRMTLLIDQTTRQTSDPLAQRRSWWTAEVLEPATGGGTSRRSRG
jgi:para-nitrobenzyl esterase